MMRRKAVYNKPGDNPHKFDVYVLGFSTNYEELRDGVGQYPVAIIEHMSGMVECVYINTITFVDQLNHPAI